MATNRGIGSAVSTIVWMLISGSLLWVGLNGVYTIWYKDYLLFADSKNWLANPCIVTKIKVEDTPFSKDKRLYTPTVEYTYDRDGKQFQSDRFWFGAKGTTDQAIAFPAAAIYQADGDYECFVKPNDPKESVLVRRLNPSTGNTFLYYTIAAGIGAIMVFGHVAGFAIQLLFGASSSEQNLRRAMVDNFCPVESGEPDEPLVIQAAESRVAVAIGLWIAGICWTGIVALIGMGLLQNREWIPLLFVSLFLLLGLAMLVFAFYSTLQIFNPQPILACSQRDIYPGSEFELSWMFRGNAKKIQNLEIVLEGVEKVSYRQGTSSRNEEKPFFRQKIVESKASETIEQGFELVSIPLETMHSFKSTNNSITWQIRVLGKIAFWPDIRDRFEIVLLAPKVNEPKA